MAITTEEQKLAQALAQQKSKQETADQKSEQYQMDTSRLAIKTGPRTVMASTTGGVSEIPFVDGKSLGDIAETDTINVQKKIKGALDDMGNRIDPTKVPSASGEGIASTSDKLTDLAKRTQQAPTSATSQQIAPVQLQQASQVATPEQIQAAQLRGTQQQLQGQTIQGAQVAAPTQMTAAQIGEIERMQAAGLSREDIEFRLGQQLLTQQLQQQAAGQGPSIAQSQLQQANEAALKQQAALAASARGGNIALAQRQALQNQAEISQQNAAKSAELRMQEQMQAREQLGNVLQASRGQDIGVATTQAQLSQEAARTNALAFNQRQEQQAAFIQEALRTNKISQDEADRFNANLQQETQRFNAQQTQQAQQFAADQDVRLALADQAAQLEAQKQNVLNSINTDQFNAKAKDEMERFKADANLRASVANQAADLQAQGMTLDQAAKMLGIEQQALSAIMSAEASKYAANTQRLIESGKMRNNMFKSTAGAVGQAIGTILSDKNQKTNIKQQDMSKFLDALSAYNYSYKDASKAGAKPGKRYGIMAQDLEKTEEGKSIVMDTKQGKMIDVEQGFGLALAALADMNKRLKKVEK